MEAGNRLMIDCLDMMGMAIFVYIRYVCLVEIGYKPHVVYLNVAQTCCVPCLLDGSCVGVGSTWQIGYLQIPTTAQQATFLVFLPQEIRQCR